MVFMDKIERAAINRARLKELYDSGITGYQELQKASGMTVSEFVKGIKAVGISPKTIKEQFSDNKKLILGLYNSGVTTRVGLYHKSGLSYSQVRRVVKSLGIEVDTKYTLSKIWREKAGSLYSSGITTPRGIANKLSVDVKQIYKTDLDLDKRVLRDYSEDIKQPCVSNERSLKCMNGKEIDLYFPESKVGVELDGEWWHSERYKYKNYHADKQGLARSGGIKLLQFWVDTQWDAKRDICIRMLENALGVSKEDKAWARKCSIVELDKVTAHNFLEEYHIQGYGPASIRYGLEHNGGLVAVMTFDKNGTLIRYATSQKVVGGFQKLLSHHRKGFNGPIRTFSDNRLFSGDIYKNAGFRLDGELPPDYMYYKAGVMKHKFGFRKEEKARDLNGWVRVYDSGKKRWVLD